MTFFCGHFILLWVLWLDEASSPHLAAKFEPFYIRQKDDLNCSLEGNMFFFLFLDKLWGLKQLFYYWHFLYVQSNVNTYIFFCLHQTRFRVNLSHSFFMAKRMTWEANIHVYCVSGFTIHSVYIWHVCIAAAAVWVCVLVVYSKASSVLNNHINHRRRADISPH